MEIWYTETYYLRVPVTSVHKWTGIVYKLFSYSIRGRVVKNVGTWLTVFLP